MVNFERNLRFWDFRVLFFLFWILISRKREEISVSNTMISKFQWSGSRICGLEPIFVFTGILSPFNHMHFSHLGSAFLSCLGEISEIVANLNFSYFGEYPHTIMAWEKFLRNFCSNARVQSFLLCQGPCQYRNFEFYPWIAKFVWRGNFAHFCLIIAVFSDIWHFPEAWNFFLGKVLPKARVQSFLLCQWPCQYRNFEFYPWIAKSVWKANRLLIKNNILSNLFFCESVEISCMYTTLAVMIYCF